MGGCALINDAGTPLRLKTRKSWALLALLAQAGEGGCRREYLASLLWPRSGEDQARASLRQELAVLRKTLKDAPDDVLDAQNDVIILRPGPIDVDSIALEKCAIQEEMIDADRIISLYQGEFAAGLNIRSALFDDWLWLERQRLRELAVGALERCLDGCDGESEPHRVHSISQAVIEIDPTVESAHQHILKSLDRLGRRAEALGQYQRIREVMRRELDTEPSRKTRDIYDTLRGDPGVDLPGETKRRGTASRPEKRALSVAAFGIAHPVHANEALGAEDISELLLQLAARCQEIVPQFGGSFLGVMGDRCLAVFGYPATEELMAERSVLSALELTGQIISAPSCGPVEVCCGIASGETLITVPEGQAPTPAQVSGVAVTQATTLSFMAAGQQVLISAATKTLLRSGFDTCMVGDPGTGNAAHLVTGERTARTRFEIDGRSLSPLMGRDKELQYLHQCRDAAHQGKGNTILVTGEPGIGKSRLLHAFLSAPETRDVPALTFCGSPHHRNTAFFPIVRELRRLLGLDGNVTEADVRQGLASWLVQLDMPTAHGVQHLMPLIFGSAGAGDEIIPGEGPAQILITCFQQLSVREPIMLIFEDLHWMDPSTRKLFDGLLSGIGT
jgi:DNA-binding SARP family transcriptional activator